MSSTRSSSFEPMPARSFFLRSKTDLDGDLHGNDLSLLDVVLDHGSKLRIRSDLLGSEEISSWEEEERKGGREQEVSSSLLHFLFVS